MFFLSNLIWQILFKFLLTFYFVMLQWLLVRAVDRKSKCRRLESCAR